MKPSFIIVFLLLSNFGIAPVTNAQRYTVSKDTSKNSIDISGNFNGADIQLPLVSKLPEFPAGKQAWQDFVLSNININVPLANNAIPGIYNVVIRFVVASEGKLTRIGADSNCGYGLENELIRCIKKSSDWLPAETSTGKKVSFILRCQVTFTVKPNDVKISLPLILANS